jgi:hypothetical protein
VSQVSPSIVTQEEEPPLEGGMVSDLNTELPFHPARHKAETKRKLAFLLVWIMAISVGVHYGVCVFLHAYKLTDAAEAMSKVFNIWLPLISGLASSAVTYYFTKDD